MTSKTVDSLGERCGEREQRVESTDSEGLSRPHPSCPVDVGPSGPDLLDEHRHAQSERETRLTLAAVTLVGLQGYLQGLDQELFTHVTRAALRAAALRAEARAPAACLRDLPQLVTTEQSLANVVGPDAGSIRNT
jgi:hypothetical protein